MKSQLLQTQVLHEMGNKNQGLKVSSLRRGERRFCSEGKG